MRLNASEGMLPGSTEVRRVFVCHVVKHADRTALARAERVRRCGHDPHRDMLHWQHPHQSQRAPAERDKLDVQTKLGSATRPPWPRRVLGSSQPYLPPVVIPDAADLHPE